MSKVRELISINSRSRAEHGRALKLAVAQVRKCIVRRFEAINGVRTCFRTIAPCRRCHRRHNRIFRLHG
jgi:hypothetical protein